MPKPPTVWVVNKGSYDYSAAKRFGVIRSVYNGRVSVYQPDRVIEEARETLGQHAMKNDFIMLSGFSLLNSIVVHYFFKRFGVVKALIHVSSSNTYRAVTLYDFEVEPNGNR